MCFGDWRIWMVIKYGKNHESLSIERFINVIIYGFKEDNGNQSLTPNCLRIKEKE